MMARRPSRGVRQLAATERAERTIRELTATLALRDAKVRAQAVEAARLRDAIASLRRELAASRANNIQLAHRAEQAEHVLAQECEAHVQERTHHDGRRRGLLELLGRFREALDEARPHLLASANEEARDLGRQAHTLVSLVAP